MRNMHVAAGAGGDFGKLPPRCSDRLAGNAFGSTDPLMVILSDALVGHNNWTRYG